jgi:hypothetical protein
MSSAVTGRFCEHGARPRRPAVHELVDSDQWPAVAKFAANFADMRHATAEETTRENQRKRRTAKEHGVVT